MSETSQTERVSDEELNQMIWKLERDGMTPNNADAYVLTYTAPVVKK